MLVAKAATFGDDEGFADLAGFFQLLELGVGGEHARQEEQQDDREAGQPECNSQSHVDPLCPTLDAGSPGVTGGGGIRGFPDARVVELSSVPLSSDSLMNSANKLIDTVRELCGGISNAALARKMHVSPQTLGQWKDGSIPMSPERVAEMCNLAKLDAPLWNARVQADAAKSSQARSMWESAARRLASAAVIVLAALPATYSGPALANPESNQAMHYAKFRARLILKWLRGQLARFQRVTALSLGATRYGPSALLAC